MGYEGASWGQGMGGGQGIWGRGVVGDQPVSEGGCDHPATRSSH